MTVHNTGMFERENKMRFVVNIIAVMLFLQQMRTDVYTVCSYAVSAAVAYRCVHSLSFSLSLSLSLSLTLWKVLQCPNWCNGPIWDLLKALIVLAGVIFFFLGSGNETVMKFQLLLYQHAYILMSLLSAYCTLAVDCVIVNCYKQ